MSTLRQVLSNAINPHTGGDGYALSLTPGFFRFYSEIGCLHALDDANLLKPVCISGASAGALVGGFLAAGMSPKDMKKPVFSIKQDDIWDVSCGFGLLRGQLVQNILERELPVKEFSECVIPFGCTAYSIFEARTKIIQSGDMATAIRASACFPVMFQPVDIDGYPHIDGGVFDRAGIMGLPFIPPKSGLVVNVVFNQAGLYSLESSVLPPQYEEKGDLFTICLVNHPRVFPNTMHTHGPMAYEVTKLAVQAYLDKPDQIIQKSPRHRYIIIDSNKVKYSPSAEILDALANKNEGDKFNAEDLQ